MLTSISRLISLATGFLLLSACSSMNGVTTQAGPSAEIPCFAANDPEVETAGFVAKTLRLSKEQDGVKYTLMTFVVGDTLTLGAMVKGGFDGLVRFDLSGRSMSFPMNTEGPLRDTAVSIDGGASNQGSAGQVVGQVVGQGASFRGTSWVNLEVPTADWVQAGGSLQLTFTPTKANRSIASPDSIALPDRGFHYVVEFKK